MAEPVEPPETITLHEGVIYGEAEWATDPNWDSAFKLTGRTETYVRSSKLEAALKSVAALEDRLEVYATSDDGTKTYLGIGDYDGIGCRDETIKLQEKNCETLRAVRKDLESRLDAALARDVMLANHHCAEDGCAVPDGYTEEGAAFAQKYHDLKAERDNLASRLDAIRSYCSDEIAHNSDWSEWVKGCKDMAAEVIKLCDSAVESPTNRSQTNPVMTLTDAPIQSGALVENQRHLTVAEQEGMRRALRKSVEFTDEKCGVCGAKWNEWHNPGPHRRQSE